MELEVIVCAEYSYDRIGPAYCMAVELGELKGVEFIARGMAARREGQHQPDSFVGVRLHWVRG